MNHQSPQWHATIATCASVPLADARSLHYAGIVDDEPDLRLVLKHSLESQGVPVREYGCAESLLEHADHVQFGCLIVDIGLPGMSGIELQSQLRRRSTDIPIVIISGQATVSDTILAFRENASAVFEKPFNNQELLQTVLSLMEAWAEQQVKERQYAEKLAALSNREREVMMALVEGKKTAHIANELGISPSTVEKHRLKIFEKTGLDSVVALLRWLGSATLQRCSRP